MLAWCAKHPRSVAHPSFTSHCSTSCYVLSSICFVAIDQNIMDTVLILHVWISLLLWYVEARAHKTAPEEEERVTSPISPYSMYHQVEHNYDILVSKIQKHCSRAICVSSCFYYFSVIPFSSLVSNPDFFAHKFGNVQLILLVC